MFEVYRNRDSTKVGLYKGMLESEGIKTMLRNWNAVTMTTEIPIPEMFPNVCVFTKEDYLKSKQIIDAHEKESPSPLEAWTCPHCDAVNEGHFAECWSCQTPIYG